MGEKSSVRVKPSWPMRLSVMSRKRRSTMFSQETPVAVKCKAGRGCLASQACNSGLRTCAKAGTSFRLLMPPANSRTSLHSAI